MLLDEERGPARAKPRAKDEVRVVGLKLRIDEGILGGLERREIELRHHRSRQVVRNEVPLALGAGEELLEEEVVGIRDLGHGRGVYTGQLAVQMQRVSCWIAELGCAPASPHRTEWARLGAAAGRR